MSINMVRKSPSVCTNFQRSSATMNSLPCAGVRPSREEIVVAEYWRPISYSVRYSPTSEPRGGIVGAVFVLIAFGHQEGHRVTILLDEGLLKQLAGF